MAYFFLLFSVLPNLSNVSYTTKRPDPFEIGSLRNTNTPSDDLLSQDPAVQVPSALKSLTSVFGMGTGVTSSPLSRDMEVVFPENWMRNVVRHRNLG